MPPPASKDSAAQLIRPDGSRLDGRGAEQLRGHFFMKPGVLSQATGSAYIEFGSTKVMVAVYGPKPSEAQREFSELGALNVDVKMAPFAGSARDGQSGLEKRFAQAVIDTFASVVLLEKYPKAAINAHVMIIEAGGSDLCAVITATSMALCDAGIELAGMVSAASVAMVRDHMILDPTSAEELYSDRSLLLALQGPQDKVAYMDLHGVFSTSEVKDAMELSLSACQFYHQRAHEALVAQLGQQGGGA